MKKIKLIFFAGLKDYFGDEIELDINESSKVEDLLNSLIDLKPDAKELLDVSRFAVNGVFVDNGSSLNTNEVAILPPSSGG